MEDAEAAAGWAATEATGAMAAGDHMMGKLLNIIDEDLISNSL